MIRGLEDCLIYCLNHDYWMERLPGLFYTLESGIKVQTNSHPRIKKSANQENQGSDKRDGGNY